MATSIKFGVAIIDTNVLDYGFKTKTRESIAEVLSKLSTKYDLVISEYLRFEIYRGLSIERLAPAKELVDSFTSYPVDKRVLDISAALTTCYECDDQTKKIRNAISDGDIILAATAFQYKFVVVTANRADFPAPYFKELSEHKFVSKNRKPFVIYELKPDVEYLNSMLNVCYPSVSGAKYSL
jgi:predicted nucleic acid-binding protein